MAQRQTKSKLPKKENNKSEKQTDIRLADMTPAELVVRSKELRGKIQSVNLERIAGKAKNIKAGYSLRKELARALTMLKSKS